MSCDIILSAADDARLTDLDFRLLGLVCKGYRSRADLAQHVKCAVNSVSRSMRRLAELGYVVRENSAGGRGKSSAYAPAENLNSNPRVNVCAPENPNPSVKLKAENLNPAVKANTTVKVSAQKLNAGVTVSPVDNPSCVYKHADARAETPININTSQDYLDRPVSVPAIVETFDLVPDEPKPRKRRAGQIGDLEYGPEFQRFAALQGFVNGSGVRLFEAFKNHHQAKGSLMVDWLAAWRTWVNNEIKFRGVPAPSQHREENHASSTGYDVRRPRVNASTAILLRQMQGGGNS